MTGLADKLAEVAAGAEPPAIEDGQARRLVDRALGLAAVQPRARTSIRWAVAIAGLAAAAAVIVLATRDRASVDELRLTLPTGDRLVSARGADFAIERLEPGNRELRLHRGTVRFEVAHVVPGQRFRVATDDLVVTAKGTVFSVDTDSTGSRVRVFEGVVEIEQGSQAQLLAAGGEWDSRTIGARPAVVATAASSGSLLSTTAPLSPSASPTPPPPAPPAGSSATTPLSTDSSPPASVGSSSTGLSPPTTATGSSSTAPSLPISPVMPPPPTTGSPSPTVSTGSSTGSSPPITAPSTPLPPRSPPLSPTTSAGSSSPTVASSGSSPGSLSSTTSPTTSTSLPGASLDDLFTAARADLAAGKLTDVLVITKRVAARGPLSGPWWQLSGDALRGLGRFAEAANAFDAAAEALAGAEHVEAGYSAAYVRFHDLHDAQTALASLELAKTDGSALEERGLGLRAQILVELGRRADARTVATRYLQRFPKADLASFMRSLEK